MGVKNYSLQMEVSVYKMLFVKISTERFDHDNLAPYTECGLSKSKWPLKGLKSVVHVSQARQPLESAQRLFPSHAFLWTFQRSTY